FWSSKRSVAVPTWCEATREESNAPRKYAGPVVSYIAPVKVRSFHVPPGTTRQTGAPVVSYVYQTMKGFVLACCVIVNPAPDSCAFHPRSDLPAGAPSLKRTEKMPLPPAGFTPVLRPEVMATAAFMGPPPGRAQQDADVAGSISVAELPSTATQVFPAS